MSFLDLFMRNNKSEKVRFLSLFSGIGAFEKALDNIGVEYDLVGFSEIDKYAVKSYCAIHGVDESMNLGDITKISEADLPKNIDLITYGFPCQDISLAGKQKGMFNEDGTQTRSGLFFEALRIIEAAKPRIAIAENVKNLTGKKFKEQFEIVLASLEGAGYNNYWKVLNAKDFGIPQNRERVFIISIRKDIDDGKFVFPNGFPLEKRLKDMLEDEVDEKFYISNSQLENLVRNGNNNCNPSGKGMNGKVHNGDVAPTLTTNKGEGPKIAEPSFVNGDICKTVRASGHGSLDRHSWDMVSEPFIAASRGRNPQNPSDRTPGAPTEQRLEPNTQGIANTLTTVQKDNYVVEPQMIQVGQMYGTDREPNPQAGRIYSADGISPTMDSCSGGNRMPKVLVREATKKGYAEAYEGDSINLEQPNSKTRRGRVGGGVANTLTTSPQQGVVVSE